MKKPILIMSGVLLLVYAALSLINLNDNYSAERELWTISHRASYAASRNESTPDFTINRLANDYRRFIAKYPKTIYANEAQLMLGRLYFIRKNYSQARQELEKAVGANPELAAQAKTNIAKTHEAEGHWDEALKAYREVIQKYPATNTGFLVPLYLAMHDQSYDNALVFYKKMAAEHPKTRVEFNALRMAATCQLNQKDWRGAVKTMGELIVKYPVAKALQEGIYAINLLCVTKLHDYDLGIGIYNQFIQKHPHHAAVGVIKKMVANLEILKSKNVTIRAATPSAKKANQKQP